MGQKLDVICVGAANLDTIASVQHVPGEDERVTTDAFVTAGGGPAATAAVTLSRLGARVGICGVIGDDYAGELVRRMLNEEKVDTTWLRTDARARTAQAYVLASRETRRRSIVTTVATEPSPDEVPIAESTWLHVDQIGFSSARNALRRGGSDTKLSVDAGNPIRDLIVRDVDLYVPTLSVLLQRYNTTDVDDAFMAATKDGARDIVATAGETGTYVLTSSGVVLINSVEVDIESTIGAGDVFHGALLAGLVRGESLIDATRAANAVAALSCRRLDGRSGIPTLAQLREFVSSQSAKMVVSDDAS